MSQPGWLDPELATLTADRFSDPAWIVMPSLAHRDSGNVSVGLNAVALVKDRYR